MINPIAKTKVFRIILLKLTIALITAAVTQCKCSMGKKAPSRSLNAAKGAGMLLFYWAYRLSLVFKSFKNIDIIIEKAHVVFIYLYGTYVHVYQH